MPSTALAISRLWGRGSPWVIMVDSRLTTGSPFLSHCSAQPVTRTEGKPEGDFSILEQNWVVRA